MKTYMHVDTHTRVHTYTQRDTGREETQEGEETKLSMCLQQEIECLGDEPEKFYVCMCQEGQLPSHKIVFPWPSF